MLKEFSDIVTNGEVILSFSLRRPNSSLLWRAWILALGFWLLEFGIWYWVFGTCHLDISSYEPSPWSLVLGIWYLEFGIWNFLL
jgi:hypothetical protein